MVCVDCIHNQALSLIEKKYLHRKPIVYNVTEDVMLMQAIKSIDELNIPSDYKAYILEYLQNLSNIPFIGRVILFGSCAGQNVGKLSDIDIFITTVRDLSEAEEMTLLWDCRPHCSAKAIPMDIIIQPEYMFENHCTSFGMVQRQIYKYGVDLSGLLH